jgi:isoquinoline 1-oxidoreductase subunit beta
VVNANRLVSSKVFAAGDVSTIGVWVGTQITARAQSVAAKAAGLSEDKVTIHQHLLGGGFGRRLEVDRIEAAVRIGGKVDGPVKIVWTREEDIRHDIYRPVYRDTISATLSGDKVIGLKYRIAGSSVIARWLPPAFKNGIDIDAVDSAVDTPYDIPNFQVEYVRVEPPGVTTGFWRGVGPNNNVFAIECFMDELARKVNKDPIAFRRDMLGKTPRLQHVLDLVAEKSNRGQPLPPRVGRGVSIQPTFNTSIATVVEPELE